MRLNPIVKKDIRVQSRSMRICWSVFAYEAIMAVVFFIALAVIETNNRYSSSNIYSQLVWLYPVLGVAQIVILGVVVPIRTASAISGEKERQTFDIMMTTSMTPWSIIVGKVTAAIVQDLFFVAASLPVMALAFVSGGLPWSYLFWFFAISLLVSLFAASIGIFCSSLCKRSITAVIMSYAIYVVFFAGTFLPVWLMEMYYMADYHTSVWYAERMMILLLLLNPAVYLIEFFARVMTGDSVVRDMLASGRGTTGGNVWLDGFFDVISSGYFWLIVSSLLFIAVSVLFLWLASKRIDPIKKRGGKKLSAQTGQESRAQI